MKPLHVVIAAGALVAATSASAHVGISFGFTFGPAPYYYPYAPRAFYAPVYYPRYYYPRYYAYPAYVVPRYAYVYPPPYAPRYYAPPPAPAPRAQPAPPPKEKAPLAAIPPKRLEKVTLSAKELFAFDRWELEGTIPKLDEIAKALKENPGITSVTITGYTDRLGTDDYNMALSKRRAESVRFYLMRQGVDGSRLNVVAKGEANPVVQCNDKELEKLIQCLEPNRRIEIEPFTVERG
jgi:OOP family OmpA-OmpF porin